VKINNFCLKERVRDCVFIHTCCLSVSVASIEYNVQSGVREAQDRYGVKGKGIVGFNAIHSQLDKDSSDSAGCVKQSRQRCKPPVACICVVMDALFLL